MSAAQGDAAIVANMVREFDFARYAATLHAPPEARRALLALAAFDLEIIRIPDQVSQPLPGEVRLQWWNDALEGTEHGGIAGHPVAAELKWAIHRFGLDCDPLLTLINAHKFDLYEDPMPTLAALEVYCDDVCGTLLTANAAVLGMDRATHEPFVRDAGRAIGITRLLARLPHDAAHRRCFMPADIIATHDVTRHQLLAGETAPGLRDARDELIRTASAYAESARAALRGLPCDTRPAFLPVATIARELDALKNAEPFALVPPPSRLRVLWSQWRAMR